MGGLVADGAGRSSPWGQLRNQVFLRSDAFVAVIRRRIPEPGGPPRGDLSEIPQARARPCGQRSEYAIDPAV